jgi:hypothetical protein
MTGERWLRFARAWFDEPTIESVVEPLVADWQHEAATLGTSRRLRTHLRWQIAVVRSLAACFADHVRKPLPPGLGSGAWLMVEGFATLGAIVLAVPIYRTAPNLALGLGTILPSALGVSLPLAAVPMLVLVTVRRGITARASRWLAVRAALILTTVMVPLAGWVIPSSNQDWRELHAPADAPRPILRGNRELTLPELFVPRVSPMVTEPIRKREAHNRMAVILMPITLCALGIAASRRVRRPLYGALTWWIFAAALWFLTLPIAYGALSRTFFEDLAPWAPHLVTFAVVALLPRLRARGTFLARR